MNGQKIIALYCEEPRWTGEVRCTASGEMMQEVTAVDYRDSIINYYDPNSAEIPYDFKLELPDYKR